MFFQVLYIKWVFVSSILTKLEIEECNRRDTLQVGVWIRFFLLFFFFWLRQTFKKQKKSLSPIPKFKDKYFVAKCSSAPSDPLTISSYTLCSIEIFAYLHTYSQWAHEWLTLLSCKKLNNTIQIIAKEQMSYWLQSKGYTVLRENTHVNKANKAFCPMQVHSRSQQIYIFSRMSTK